MTSEEHANNTSKPDKSPGSPTETGNDEEPPTELVDRIAKDPKAVAQIVQTQVSGPLPAASEFSAYEETLPGSADRILTMAEEQAAHRRKVTEADAESGRKLNHRGQKLGAGLIALAIVLATIGGIWGSPLVAIAVASPSVILLVVFGLLTAQNSKQ